MAKKRSIGEPIRSACEKQYGLIPEDEAFEAVNQLAVMSLPVDDPGVMKWESVPKPSELLPDDAARPAKAPEEPLS